MRCPHCKGTGEVPNKIKQECVNCQRTVVVSYETTAELIAMSPNILCAECKVQERRA